MMRLLKLIGRPLFRVLFSVEYYDVKSVPESGPVIIAGNHPSYLDPLLIALPVRRVIRFMAWDALFKIPLLGRVIKSLGAFPVELGRGKGEAAYREALKVLSGGEALGIFPEGQRSDAGPMGELKSGVARLAIETGAPIVPVTIGGASRAWPKKRLLPKPAKIIIRFHKPIYLDEAERARRADDRAYQREIMARLAASINRSLTPALRGSESFERWYRQPPSHIRSYEWAPAIVAMIVTVVAFGRGALARNLAAIWLPAAAYYLYLVADLTLIKPARAAKWLRNSMPIWLAMIWHYPLVKALDLPAGELNGVLACAALGAFFGFFWEDYYTLQKFVRGLVVVYYVALAMLLGWPHPLGVLTAILCFIAIFSLVHRTVYYQLAIGAMLSALAAAVLLTGSFDWRLVAYAALSVLAIFYLQTFVGAAYDIRKAGDVSIRLKSEALGRGR